jgi:putative ABC transport system permease protein
MNTLFQDLRYACRAFLDAPGFTLAAVLSLAIGIGANTAIFSVVDALLLRALPYKDSDRLVILWNRSPGLNITQDWFSTAQYFDIKNGQRSFEDVAIAIGGVENVTGDGEPERIGTIHVSSNLLPMLGARAAQGRLFTPDEDAPGGTATAVLGYGTWVRRYGGDVRAVGRSVTVNGKSYQIVGVLPQSFSLPREVMPTLNGAEDAEVLLPLPLAADAISARNREDYNIVARLKRGATAQQAQAEMDTLTARLRRDHPELYPPNGGLTFGVVPLQEQVVGDVRRLLLILLASVGCVLVIACANVANLLLSRALARRREIAIRAALGASRARLVRQLLTESVVLALGGGMLGVLLALGATRVIHLLGAKQVPRIHEIGVNGEVLLFTLALSVLSGIVFGLAPALRLARRNVLDNLQDAARGSAAAGGLWGARNNLRKALVVAELGLSVVLLVAAGLLLRSFVKLERVSPGFNPSNLLTLELKMTGRRYDGNNLLVHQTYQQLWGRLERLPGVSAAGGVTSLPLSQMFAWGPIVVEGRPLRPGESFINADQRVAGGDYFQAMQIPLIAGRFFDEADTPEKPRVAIIDEFMARELWPGQDPLGKRIKPAGVDAPNAPWLTVVGVVGRIKQDALDSESRIAFYISHTQYPARTMNVVLRSGSAPVLTSAVKKEIRELDPDLPLYNVRTMAQRVDESLARRRFAMVLLGAFAGLALALATVGIYGVIAYLVSQGTREIGIRIALGARPQDILRLVLGQGLAMALTGAAVGLAGALVFARFLASLLYGISATDALTFTAIPLLLILIAFAASYIPARRAARVDPMISLRCE